jgi:large subunit ribosomal protein L32
MPAVPKRKYAKARQGERRSHLALKPKGLAECPTCHNLMLPHQVCPSCGSYRGREIIPMKHRHSH